MPKYNIIYTSPHDDHYLWNGISLDKLEKEGQEVLMFSGKNFKEGELKDAINDCEKAAKQLFSDKNPKVKTIEIAVSD